MTNTSEENTDGVRQSRNRQALRREPDSTSFHTLGYGEGDRQCIRWGAWSLNGLEDAVSAVLQSVLDIPSRDMHDTEKPHTKEPTGLPRVRVRILGSGQRK